MRARASKTNENQSLSTNSRFFDLLTTTTSIENGTITIILARHPQRMALQRGITPEHAVEGSEYEEEILEEVIEEDQYDLEQEDEESVGDEDYLTSIRLSMQREFLARKSNSHSSNREVIHAFREGGEASDSRLADDEQDILEEIIDDSNAGEDIYEEQVIEKWFQVDSLPDDLESACRQLIPIVYKGEEHAAPETMMRRTPLVELYRYLKQHYDYKKDIKKEISEETAQEIASGSTTQSSLQDLFRQRSMQTTNRADGVQKGDAGDSSNHGRENRITDQSSCHQDHKPQGAARDNAVEDRTNVEGGRDLGGGQYTIHANELCDDDSARIPEGEYILEEDPDYTSNLPDVSKEFMVEEILEGSSRLGFGCSLQDLGGSTRSYIEEIVEGMSTRSLIEEEIIEEEEEECGTYDEEEVCEEIHH